MTRTKAKRRKHRLTLDVVAPRGVSPRAVCRIVNKLINVGLADAGESHKLDDFHDRDAALALRFEITTPFSAGIEDV